MEAAERDLQTAEGKVQHGMLWFTSSELWMKSPSSISDVDSSTALAVWQKACARPEISANYIVFEQLGSSKFVHCQPLKNISRGSVSFIS